MFARLLPQIKAVLVGDREWVEGRGSKVDLKPPHPEFNQEEVGDSGTVSEFLP